MEEKHRPSVLNKYNGGKELSADDKLAFLAEKAAKVLEEKWWENLRKNGQKTYFVAFDVPETDHEARLRLSKEVRKGQESWLLSIGVARSGSRRLHSYFLCHGDGQEGLDKVLAYLTRPEFKTELVTSVKELSAHVDQAD